MLMQTIFMNALAVEAWLGEASSDSDQAMEFVRNMSRQAGSQGRTPSLLEWLQKPNHPWEALISLLERPWWRRVWVVQEVILAKRVTVNCGSKSVDFQAFDVVYSSLLQFDPDTMDSFFASEVGEDLGPRFGFALNFSVGTLTGVRLDLDLATEQETLLLLETAVAYLPCQATDPRDKIYALLGLLGGRRQEDVLAFTPNYNMSAKDLYKEFARYFILKGKVQNILERCGGPYRVQGLPSWAPDWANTEFVSHIEFFDAGPDDEHRFRASGDLPSSFEFSSDSIILFSKGMLISRVKSMSSIVQPADHMPATFAATFHESLLLVLNRDISERLDPANSIEILEERFAEDFEQPYIAGGTKDDALQRALRASPTDHSEVTTEADKEAHTGVLTEFRNPQNEVGDSMRIYMVLRGRRVCLSLDGYIGIVPLETKDNDWICIFHGMSVPFIVREHEDGYTLIGDCYVQGLMEGEAAKNLEEGLLEVQTISLV